MICPFLPFLNLHPQTPSSTVRTSFKWVDGPIRCAESDGNVHFGVHASVMEIWRITCPILPFFNLHPLTPSSTVRTSFKWVDGPIRCAESDGNVRFDVHALVMEIWQKTCPILPFLNIHPQTPSSTVRTSFKSVDRPIRCAESDGDDRSDVRALCVEIW